MSHETILETERDLKVSFEFFPPRSLSAERQLWQEVRRLELLGPHFVSVTYGAGGSTRHRTHEMVARIAAQSSLRPAAHLTCVGSTDAEITQIAEDYWQAGVRHIVALRGDQPLAGAQTNGFQYASELVSRLKQVAPFEISVAAFPERHPENNCWQQEIDTMKRKVDAGADRAITQFFFDNDLFEAYVERIRAAGIDIPIIPGLLPVQNFAKLTGFAERCQASIPAWMHNAFDGLADDPDTHKYVAAAIAAEQAFDLIERGVDRFHFYTLNQAELTFAVCHMMGVRPRKLSLAA